MRRTKHGTVYVNKFIRSTLLQEDDENGDLFFISFLIQRYFGKGINNGGVCVIRFFVLHYHGKVANTATCASKSCPSYTYTEI